MKHGNLKNRFLNQSAIIIADKPELISTILGSCVSVCLWDKKNNIGGINHYLLPLWNGKGLASPKYGNIAIELTLEKLLKSGSRQNNIVAKVFGGAAVLQTTSDIFHIGERNIDIAFDMLKKFNIPVAAKHIGGKQGRKIMFNPHSGQVFMKLLIKN